MVVLPNQDLNALNNSNVQSIVDEYKMRLSEILKNTLYATAISLCVAMPVFAQQQTEQTKQENTKPMELPNFIINGVEQLNVRTGIKQVPGKPNTLTNAELDSLNSLEKQFPALIAADPLPSKRITEEYQKGFVKGGIGLFATPELEAGYGINLEGYELYANAGYTSSSGDVKRSDFSKYFVDLNSNFIAPAKYWVFGGSRTRTNINLHGGSYNLYPLLESQQYDNYKDKNYLDFTAKIDVDGKYESVGFAAGAGFSSLQLSRDDKAAAYSPVSKSFENILNGYVKIENNWNNFVLGGNLDLDLRSFRGKAVNFLQGDISLVYFNSDISLALKGGLQTAANSSEVNRSALLLEGIAEYRMNKDFTLRGAVSSGLSKNTFKELFNVNPYLSYNSKFDFAYDIALIRANIIWHPNDKLGISSGIRWRISDRLPFMMNSPQAGEYDLAYETGYIGEINFETFYQITKKDKISGYAALTNSGFTDFNESVPYIPALKLSFDYYRHWTKDFGSQLGLSYIGERNVVLDKSLTVDSYINLNAMLDYRINKQFSVCLLLDNLLNSDIYLFDGYKERGLFASVSIMWQF